MVPFFFHVFTLDELSSDGAQGASDRIAHLRCKRRFVYMAQP